LIHRRSAVLRHVDSAKNESGFPHPSVSGQVPIRVLNQTYLLDDEAFLLVFRSNVRFGFRYISLTESGIASCHAERERKNNANASSHKNSPTLASKCGSEKTSEQLTMVMGAV
jgi:hypothetical protein